MKDKFSTFKVGFKRAFAHAVTADDVKRFVELSGDTNPVHTDADYAARTEMRRPVVHGMLTAAYVSRLVGKYLPGDGALWISQSFEFQQPVFIGDTLSVEAEVKQRSESQRLLVIDVRVKNQAGRVVLKGEGKVRVTPPVAEEGGSGRKPLPRVALITGASRGIGAACARRLAQDGYAVAINYAADHAAADRLVKEIIRQGGKAAAYAGDVCDEAAVAKIVDGVCQRWGGLSLLVNNAGRALRLKPAQDLQWAEISENLEIYLKAAFQTSRAVLLPFQRQGGGSIINIGSIVTDSRPPVKFTAYAVAKEALWALTKNLAAEWGLLGVRVNMVSPGMTETALIEEIPARSRLMTKLETPLRRLATPEDIAGAVAFLASRDAGHISGENLRVCGGAVML